MRYYKFNKYVIGLNLRQFDEGNNPVNATTSSGAGNDLSTQLRTYYDRTLLQNAKPKLVYGQFAMVRPIPKNGGQTINWRRFDKLAPATTPLVEGKTPLASKLNVNKVEATVKQYGAYYILTDWLQLTAPDPILTEAARNLGDNAGETYDIIDREALMLGTNVYYGDGSVKVRTGIAAAMKPTLDGYKQCVRILKRADAPTWEGNTYVAIIHPDTWYDLTKEFEELAKYTETGLKKIFEGELGNYQGVRFVETSHGKIYSEAGATNSADSKKQDVYADIVLGKNAYGTTSIKGSGVETIAKQLGSSGVSDALNQRSSIGWKGNRATKIVSEIFMVRYEHATSTNEHEAN